MTAADIAAAAAAMAGAAVAMLQLETSDEGAHAFATMMRDAGALVMLNPAPGGLAPPDTMELVNIIVPNQLEAEALTGRVIATADDAFAAVGTLLLGGATAAVITLGDRGAIGVSDGARVVETAADVVAIDTVGAGDAFCAGLAVSLGEGAAFARAVRFANAAGALACTKRGAEPSMPYRRDVEALLAARG